ncbi:phage protease [Pseudorhodobacter sp.]|uniref:phage protease n=1 Tax=Pseudorhodobacter sp. TaxID=1934400 RepID=UPI00264A3186|nr:phage protease [Pseudorhodobacter sp.]MDN5787119.1 phage protease [Pseudorhodobacter sp.]
MSPSFLHDKAGQIMRLKGAGLVHRPNLYLKALASEEETMPPDDINSFAAFVRQLAVALGLSPDSTADDVMTALAPKLAPAQEMAPDPRKYVPVDAVADLLQDRNLRIFTMQEAQTTALVEKAFMDGYITPGMRAWATALCQQDPESFKLFLRQAPRPYDLSKPMPRPYSAFIAQGDDSEQAAAICSQLGLKPETLNAKG